jgi:hypothetical protein
MDPVVRKVGCQRVRISTRIQYYGLIIHPTFRFVFVVLHPCDKGRSNDFRNST